MEDTGGDDWFYLKVGGKLVMSIYHDFKTGTPE